MRLQNLMMNRFHRVNGEMNDRSFLDSLRNSSEFF